MNAPKPKERWGSRFGVILAVTGSAVGLGNFLRFPGLAAKYEGGAFMIPYFIALLLLGLPLAWVEWAMGRYGGRRGFNSTPGIFRVIARNNVAPYFGVLGLLVPVVIYMYYVFIESWCLSYAWYYLKGAMELGKDPAAYGAMFADHVGANAHGSLFKDVVSTPLVFLAICFALNFVLIYRGISKGIELFCLWAMPVLILCALIVLVRVLTLGTPDPTKPELNLLNGLGFMWNPSTSSGSLWKALGNAKMWMEAAGQIFFSLSVGFGVVITYASYLRRRDDIALGSTTAVAGNEFCEVTLGGLITIPAAFIFLGVAGTQGSSLTLGFKTLPLVFEHMPLGRWVGVAWFFLLFLAAVTSSLSMLQPAIAFLEEGLALTRRGSVAILGFITLAGSGFVVWFSRDLAALDTFDFWAGTFCIYVLATTQVILFAWVLGAKKGLEELNSGAHLRIPRVFTFVVKYISPLYLIAVFVMWVKQDIGAQWTAFMEDESRRLSVGFIIAVAALFLLLIAQSIRRWNRVAPLDKIEK
jgi:NSS family neurotransmitter:Na+ symporter